MFFIYLTYRCVVSLSLKKKIYDTTGFIMLQFRIYSAAHLNQKPGICVCGAKKSFHLNQPVEAWYVAAAGNSL